VLVNEDNYINLFIVSWRQSERYDILGRWWFQILTAYWLFLNSRYYFYLLFLATKWKIWHNGWCLARSPGLLLFTVYLNSNFVFSNKFFLSFFISLQKKKKKIELKPFLQVNKQHSSFFFFLLHYKKAPTKGYYPLMIQTFIIFCISILDKLPFWSHDEINMSLSCVLYRFQFNLFLYNFIMSFNLDEGYWPGRQKKKKRRKGKWFLLF
jgi:hypothetical protein